MGSRLTEREPPELDLRPIDGSHEAEVERLLALEPDPPRWVRAKSPGWCSPTRKTTSSASSARSPPPPSQGREAAGWA
jgi:hypothetical protein